MNTTEFSLRENNTGSFPRGLSLMLRAMAPWIYDKDPFQPLRWTEDLASFKAGLCRLVNLANIHWALTVISFPCCLDMAGFKACW